MWETIFSNLGGIPKKYENLKWNKNLCVENSLKFHNRQVLMLWVVVVCNLLLPGFHKFRFSLKTPRSWGFEQIPIYLLIRFLQQIGIWFHPHWSKSQCFCEVNSIQEACNKCFVVHTLKLEIWQTTWKNKLKNNKNLNLLIKNWKLRAWCSLFHFSPVICRISNFNMWATKHLVQASCTELTLQNKKNVYSILI